ncbi:zinc finger CCHC domain-containing protein 7 [Labrus bergylta]|uniref:zinc finger CCHC domain-containing protein 7 n=1 Tax=Labrus bergylta TaxID=56723 RepID=UPI0033133E15
MDNENKDRFFIEEFCSSEGEDEIKVSRLRRHKICKESPRPSMDSSPPLVLVYNNPSPVSSLDLQGEEDRDQEDRDQEEDRDQPVEEWMILGSEEQVGDSSIHLNLSYWDNSADDSGDEDQNVKSEMDTWQVSEKDKCGAEKSQPFRYWVPGNFQACNICNRMGHLAKSCYYQKKCPTCVLCGIQGHILRDCPRRPCSSCGLPSHCFRPCERPPVWNQHCKRCRMAGHLSDACPDLWRQYHLTIQLEVPVRPSTVHTPEQKEYLTFCYNCSKMGHYGYECSKRRMVSGMFPSLPFVIHYDSINDILKHNSRMHEGSKELISAGCLPFLDQQTELTQESGEENLAVQGRSKTKQVACSQACRRKTWPERRRERREVKKLRREAQARREGGLLGRSKGKFDDEVCPSDPSRSLLHGQKSPSPPQKKRRDEAGDRRSRKSREAERWKKRGGLKHGDLYPHGDVDISSENFLSPKQRVRHRRR